MMADLQLAPAPPVEPPPFKRFLLYFLELGSVGFGGPIATVGYMQRDLVEQRRWMSRQDLLDGIALGQTMPGPLAAQVAMWVGFLRRGAVGARGGRVGRQMIASVHGTVDGLVLVGYQLAGYAVRA